eukprot:TRINITY_DN52079_c0_g1_i1.p4 TRINITY_DN52079_c0_g1~~TRINITY_DN52079_c0_g1_i1.p4  ORF type:complete len:121 (+),score=0.18 TRINITY_DN52079_c0_g1_i1:260-622(+)
MIELGIDLNRLSTEQTYLVLNKEKFNQLKLCLQQAQDHNVVYMRDFFSGLQRQKDAFTFNYKLTPHSIHLSAFISDFKLHRKGRLTSSYQSRYNINLDTLELLLKLDQVCLILLYLNNIS